MYFPDETFLPKSNLPYVDAMEFTDKNLTREVTDEGDCSDGSGCGNGRGETGGAA
jgi:hypothetical protein